MVCKEPFPHFILDDFFPAEVLEGVLEDFERDDIWNKQNNHEFSQKRTSTLYGSWGSRSQFVFDVLKYQKNMLETAFNIQGLVEDPTMEGGGLHRIEEGGFLRIHTDFVKHHTLDLYRRINGLLYLNDDFTNGDLELWKDGRLYKGIKPRFNRLVFFETSDISWHGHPDPLKGGTRKSMAVYFYTKEPPSFEIADNTVYLESL